MSRLHHLWQPALAMAITASACAEGAHDRNWPSAGEVPIGGDLEEILDETPDWDFGEVPDNSDRLKPPEIHGMDPATGSTLGGDEVIIHGVGFLHIDRLTFNGVPSPDWSVRGVEEILAITPPGEAGPATIAVDGSGGASAFAGLFEYVSDVTIDSIEPAQAPVGGGTRFTLRGSGFSNAVTVLVGARTAIAVEVESDDTLTAWYPANDVGPQDLWVFSDDGSGKAVARQAVRYRIPPQVRLMRPSVGPVAGGTPVEVIGRGFESDVRVVIGGKLVDVVVSADGEQMRFVTPGGRAPGTVGLAVHSPVGDGGLPAAFAYLDPDDLSPKLHAVRPGQGPIAGGNQVDVLVGDVSGGARVTFGGLEAACDQPDSGVMRCLAPPNQPGSVRVAVKGSGATASLPDGYTYLSPLSLTDCLPADGRVEGGAIATLKGSGFKVGSRVWFGPMESQRVRFISDGTLTAVVPPGAAGTVDITISLSEGRGAATLEGGFEYQDRFRILAIDPDTGARAGGTYVAILGTGFTPGLRPSIGGRDAVDVRFRGSTRYTFKTPPGPQGAADVDIPGVATLPKAFTFFNPATRYGGVWGREIQGSVNVTLLSAGNGDPVVAAFAMLGTDPATKFQGVTDNRGQVTLSGPHLTGPVTVTCGKEAYENQTFVLIEGENVTMYLTPLVPPTAGNGSRTPPPPVDGTINGIVAGIDKYVPEPRHEDEERVAYVETTRESVYRPNPDPGENIMTEDGVFTITSRPGDLAVVVVAGLLDRRTDTFVPYRMGVARWLFMPILGELNDVYVELTVPLTRRLGVTLVDAPVGRDEGPNQLQATPWFEFRPEGWFGGYNKVEGPVTRDYWIEGMPLFRSADFDDVQMHMLTSMFTDGSRPMVMRWDHDLDWDGMFLDIGPFAGIPKLTDPAPDQPVANNRFAWTYDSGVRPTVWSMRMMTQAYQPIWRIIAPGTVDSMVLPKVAALPTIPVGRHLLTFSGGVTDGWTPRQFEYGDLSVRGWESWSAVWEPFRVVSE